MFIIIFYNYKKINGIIYRFHSITNYKYNYNKLYKTFFINYKLLIYNDYYNNLSGLWYLILRTLHTKYNSIYYNYILYEDNTKYNKFIRILI